MGNDLFSGCSGLKAIYVYNDSLALQYCIDNNLPYEVIEDVAVKSVKLDPAELQMNPDDTATLTAIVKPDNATNKAVLWKSSDTSVATVEDGRVTAVKPGSAVITCISMDDVSKTAKCKVVVGGGASDVLATSIALDKTEVILKVGETATLLRTILPDSVTTTKGGYKVSNKAVFEVSATKKSGNTCKYTIKAVGVGTAKLTVSTKDGTKLSAACTVTVVPDVPEKSLTKTGSNGTVKVEKGDKLQLVTAFATEKGWKIKSISSSNKKIASVTASGLVTAKKDGTVTITVKTKNGKKATVKIKVVDPKIPTKVTLDKTGTVKLKKGKSLQLKATVLPETAETKLTWQSSNKKIATVSQDGLVKAKKKGTVTITVKTKNGKKATVKIKVVK